VVNRSGSNQVRGDRFDAGLLERKDAGFNGLVNHSYACVLAMVVSVVHFLCQVFRTGCCSRTRLKAKAHSGLRTRVIQRP